MRLRSIIGALTFAVVLGLSGTMTAQAAPTPVDDKVTLPIEWEGPATNLSWDGNQYGTAVGTILGQPVAVPGDRVEHGAIVRNAGPSDALATVQIREVSTTNAVDTLNPELEELIHVFWDIDGHTGDESWRDLRTSQDSNGVSLTLHFPVKEGGQFHLTMGYYFPVEATGGRSLGQTSSALNFEVGVQLQGEPKAHGLDAGTGGSLVQADGPAVDGWPILGFAAVVLGFAGLATARLTRRQASVAQR